MSLTENGNGLSAADVAAVMGNNGNGFGWGGDGAWWLIVLFLFAFAGNGFGNGFGGNGGGMFYPWMMGNTQNDVQRGFDQSAVMSGIGAIQNSLANAEVSRCNAQANVLQTLNNNQAASLQAMNALAMSLQNCCCENRAGVADLKYTVATENCADRQVVSDGFRDLTVAIGDKVQMVMDKLCALELDGVKQRNQDLLAENNALKFAQSQEQQNGYFANALNNAVARLNPTPIPAYAVQNPNCCTNQGWNGCGCGCNG